ncbi:MAG: DUF1848 domain-containing protein [Spirochaetota bacterium]|nr:DUF1848 domain-containing protein [Spirochaetota bacterium]
MNIISASRRTDIPAFYGDWLMARLREGYSRYRNPYNQKEYEVSLKPQDVSAIVFWSKNYQPMLNHLKAIDKSYPFYCHFTITGLPKDLEQQTPPLNQAINTFRNLSDSYSPKRVLWRYDPIVFSTETSIDYHMERFTELATQLKGYTERCYISFVQRYYKKVRRQFDLLEKDKGLTVSDPSSDTVIKLLSFMKATARENNITLYSCCQDQNVDSELQKAHCVDSILLNKLYPHKSFTGRLNPTRSQCGCFKSIDIGAYDTCPHGCIYCYANVNQEKARLYHSNHSVESHIL